TSATSPPPHLLVQLLVRSDGAPAWKEHRRLSTRHCSSPCTLVSSPRSRSHSRTPAYTSLYVLLFLLGTSVGVDTPFLWPGCSWRAVARYCYRRTQNMFLQFPLVVCLTLNRQRPSQCSSGTSSSPASESSRFLVRAGPCGRPCSRGRRRYRHGTPPTSRRTGRGTRPSVTRRRTRGTCTTGCTGGSGACGWCRSGAGRGRSWGAWCGAGSRWVGLVRVYGGPLTLFFQHLPPEAAGAHRDEIDRGGMWDVLVYTVYKVSGCPVALVRFSALPTVVALIFLIHPLTS
ncbi:hypothetical protein B0H14DRAFT_3683863, partial [Mycena olivaceomarginata]